MTHKSSYTEYAGWNWQREDWPDFTYKKDLLREVEEQAIKGLGFFYGSLEYLDKKDSSNLMVEIITDEALKTSEIEGEYLNRPSLKSSIRRHFGLQTASKDIPSAERGIANMMVSLYEGFADKLTNGLLCQWHEMVMSGRTDLEDVGCYRKGEGAMQVVSGPIGDRKVHFEAPPSEKVPSEMEAFIKWFNESAPTGKTPLTAITRAGIAHIYFVSIHPFEDGNGRISRAIAEKALAQCFGQPTLIALSSFIEENRKNYYDALETINRTNEVTEWLTYFGGAVIGGQKRSQELVRFLVRKAKMFDRLQSQLNDRQEKVLLRMFQEGPKGFKGGLSAGNYVTIAKTTRQTATRDLSDLVKKGALSREGEGRYARYYLRVER